MNSRYGYAGNILRVDLTTSKLWTEPTEKYSPQFLSGKGINQWILLKELRPWVTPFEPANIICFGAGTLVGTMVPGAARLSIDSKNVLTAGIGSGNAGGWFSAELKFAGYDNIVIHGKANLPVYLWIEDDKVSLRSAIKLWGKKTVETMALIKEDLGQEEVQILCIGPAGENMTKSACIIVDSSRAVGRCGLGSVMGSKNLKAIVVKGNGTIDVKKPEEFMALVDQVSQRLRRTEGAKGRRQYGTFMGTSSRNELSGLAYKNFYDDHIPNESLDKISYEVFHSMQVDRHACTACPTACGHVYRIDSGPYSGTECVKSEANAVWDFGGKLAIDDPCAILKAQEECCQLGLDIDNSSSVIGWAIDCFQNNVISKKDTDGIELNWGDHAVILELLKKIAYREGFGNILAEGAHRASQIVGRGSEKYAFHIKGQDLIEGIRAIKGWALGVVVSARGGAHTRGAPNTETVKYSPEKFGLKMIGDARTYEGKPKIVRYFEYVHSLGDSLGVCFFTTDWVSSDGITPKAMAQFYSLATGMQKSEGEMMIIAERIHNIEKMFNVYHAGFTRKDDYPPVRLMEEPVKTGSLRGERLDKKDWDKMLDTYYSLHGWDKCTSWPTKNKLEELNLDECIEMLEQAKQIYNIRI